jgi:hypothetical protein
MKKITFNLFAFCFLLSAFFLLLSPFSLHAQEYPLPDEGSFETWTTETGHYGEYDDYKTEFFCTLNSLYGLKNEPQGAADRTAWKDGNARHGQCCIKLVSGKVPVGEDIFLPGMVGTLSEEYVEEYLSEDREVVLVRDWAYDTPHALRGWYKYKPVNKDSAFIEIGFSNFGDGFIERMIIKETVEYWTEFIIPIPKKYQDKEYGEFRLLFVASADVDFQEMTNCHGQLGSTLWIDNISLDYNYEIGIKQDLLSSLKANAYPNPTVDLLNVELNEPFTGNIVVFDLSGRKIMEDTFNGTEGKLNIAALAPGNYIYRLMKENTFFAQGKFVVAQ